MPNYICMPGKSSSFKVQSWENWDETRMRTLASNDTFICFYDGAEGEDEVGLGCGLTGADATITDGGGVAIPAATGTPLYRSLTTSNQWFSASDAICNIIAGEPQWTLILKANIANTTAYAMELQDTGYQLDYVVYNREFHLVDADNTSETQSCTDYMYATNINYLSFWCDGTVTRAGFTTTRPTLSSHFTANSRVEFTKLFDNFATFSSGQYFQLAGISSLAYGQTMKVYYSLISRKCLITNDD